MLHTKCNRQIIYLNTKYCCNNSLIGISRGAAPIYKSNASGAHTVFFDAVLGYTTHPSNLSLSHSWIDNFSHRNIHASISATTGSTYTLSFQCYDHDNLKEVTISLNGDGVISLPASESPQNNLSTSFTLDTSKYVVAGSNTITFQQNLYSSGIKNLSV